MLAGKKYNADHSRRHRRLEMAQFFHKAPGARPAPRPATMASVWTARDVDSMLPARELAREAYLADSTIMRSEGVAIPVEGRPARAAPLRSTLRRYGRIGRWMAATDAASVMAGLVVTRAVHRGTEPFRWPFLVALAVAALVWVGVFAAFQLYSFTRLSPADEFRRIVEASAVTVAVKLAVSLVYGRGALGALARGWIILAWAVALVLSLIARHAWHKHMGHLRARGELSFRTLIVGANQEALHIARTLKQPAHGFKPLGLIATGASTVVVRDELPLLGSIGDLGEIIEANAVECVFVASSAVTPDLMKRLMKHLRRHDVELRVSANMTDILASRLTIQPIEHLLSLSLRPVRLTGPQAAAKRSFDLALAGAAVVLAAPLWIAVSLLIKLTSRGPVLFSQLRVGREGRPFTLYKFRTMIQGAELLRAQLEARNEASGPLFKMRDDPRITWAGRWLRRWSLDELPQLMNVLRGEMSLVGPRPALPKEVALYEDWHHDRLEVRPGLTGEWQAGGRSNLTFDDYVRLDLFYIENWSISRDLFILLKTIPAVLFSKGAF